MDKAFKRLLFFPSYFCICSYSLSLGPLLNILFTLSCLLITGGGMNIVVYYVIQCGNDNMTIFMSALSFSVSAKHLRELSKCFLYLLINCNLAQMWNAAFFFFLDSSKSLKFARRCRPWSFFLSPWLQAKRLSANNTPRQRYNQKHSVVLYTSWQQVCSCDGFLCHLNYLWKVKV